MNKKQIVEKLVKIANDLDVLDLSNESDQLTKVAEKVLLAEIEYSPDFNPDYEADDAEAKTISSPVYDAALALVKAHKAGKMTDEEFASAVAAMADESSDTSDNVKELTFENNMPDIVQKKKNYLLMVNCLKISRVNHLLKIYSKNIEKNTEKNNE